jgi:hypothetical protein
MCRMQSLLSLSFMQIPEASLRIKAMFKDLAAVCIEYATAEGNCLAEGHDSASCKRCK